MFLWITKGLNILPWLSLHHFQGLPKGKSRKKDHKANTIETEPHYLQFLESLKDEEAEGKSEMKMEYSFQLKDGTLNYFKLFWRLLNSFM